MPDLTLAQILIPIFSTVAALALVWFTRREMRWYSENVRPEPTPPLARALRRVVVKIKRWRRG
jgi:hypothetical protein